MNCYFIAQIQIYDENEFKRWYESTEYKTILQHRLRAAKCDTVLAKGLTKAN